MFGLLALLSFVFRVLFFVSRATVELIPGDVHLAAATLIHIADYDDKFILIAGDQLQCIMVKMRL